ncbi:MAG: sulfite exporter TauE/SafE family protein [Candidatus Latescibacterota bacterium]
MPDFYIYLPIAGISVNIFLLLGLGLIVGFLSGLFGVGGGFLLTPLLMMIGIPPTVAAASDANQIVAASTSGTFAHWRLGNVDIKMGVILIVGGILGGTVGVQLIKVLRAAGNADFIIKITYVVMLGVIGSYMFQESLKNLRPRRPTQVKEKREAKSWFERVNESLPLQVHMSKSGVTLSIFTPLFLGTCVGVLSALMGVGGGFIMVPVMVYMLRMPMHVVVGTSLFQVLCTCINVTFMQAYYNHTVDLMLAILLLIGSTTGAQIGARISNRLKADQLKIILASIVLIVMINMAVGLIIKPDLMLSFAGGH